MLNIISTCRDILCVDINVDKRCVDHSTNSIPYRERKGLFHIIKSKNWQGAPTEYSIYIWRKQRLFHIIKIQVSA